MKKNNRVLLSLASMLLLVLSTQALSNKDKPICFRHKETHNIVRPCQMFKSDNDNNTQIFCMDADETMQQFKPPNLNHWERLEGDICNPQRFVDDVPRGKKLSTIHLFSGCRPK